MKKRTFDQAYRRVLKALEARAKVIAAEKKRQAERRRMIQQLGRMAARGLALARSGKVREARVVLRRAQLIENKLGLSSRKG